MKNVFGVLLIASAFFLSVPGCGPGDPVNVVEDAGQTELEKYEAMREAEAKSGEEMGAGATVEAP